VNNWQLSQITTLMSSPPTTASVNISGFAYTGALNTGSLNGLGGFNRVPFFQANGLDLDRTYRVDARLTKILPFTERFKVYLQFEAFNVFNTPTDTSRRTAAFQENAANLSLIPLTSYGSGSASQGFPDGTNVRRAQASLRLVF